MDELQKFHSKLDELIEKLDKPGIGSHVTWDSSGGPAYGKIVQIIDRGKVPVPKTKITLHATQEEPVAVIELHDKEHKPTGQIVGHKLSSVRRA